MKVGVTLPMGNHTDAPIESYPTIRALASMAEAIGLDSIWGFDHLLFRIAGRPDTGADEGWTLLAAVAAETERVDVGMLVTGLRLRNPALLAKIAVTLDEVSGGRLILGVGAGWHEPELEAFGYPIDHRVGRFEEALTVLASLLRTGIADFDGRWVSARSAVLLPPPRRDIPILIAARSPRMLGLTARHADLANIAWFAQAGDPVLRQRSDLLDEACRAAGRDPGSLGRTVGVNIRFEGAIGPGPVRRPPGELPTVTNDPESTLRGFSDAGFAHAIVWLEPMNERSLDPLGNAVARL